MSAPFEMIGGIFFSKNPRALGIPVFSRKGSNLLFAPVIDEKGEIERFLSIDADRYTIYYFGVTGEERNFFRVGDKFDIFVVRLNGILVAHSARDDLSVKTRQAVDAVDDLVSLQFARLVFGSKKRDVLGKLGAVARSFDLPQEEQSFFEISELRIAEIGDGLWQKATPEPEGPISMEEALAAFRGWQIGDFESYLRRRPSNSDIKWSAAFIACKNRFGMSEFLYERGKSYCREVIFSGPKYKTDYIIFRDIFRRHSSIFGIAPGGKVAQLDTELVDLVMDSWRDGEIFEVIFGSQDALSDIVDLFLISNDDYLEKSQFLIECLYWTKSTAYSKKILKEIEIYYKYNLEDRQVKEIMRDIFSYYEVEAMWVEAGRTALGSFTWKKFKRALEAKLGVHKAQVFGQIQGA